MIMKLKFDKLFFVFIIIIAVFFRFLNLSLVPPQPSVDEVSIGYNAFSILKTGADEYGNKIPVLLRAYDDWRPAIYVYLVIPFISLFGLNEVSIRLPSVILSVLSVIAVYFLTRYLTKGTNEIKLGGITLDIPLVATFLFAISPMSIYLSRLGHEANASFSFLLFGILFFLRFIEKQKWNLFLSGTFLALSFNSYQSGKIVVPALILVFIALYFKKLLKEKAHVLLSALLLFFIILPILLSSFDENALIRFKGTSLLGNSPAYFEKVFERSLVDRQKNDLFGLIYDNRKAAGVLLISNAYFSHFDPVWLFLNKGEEPFKAPAVGLLYLFELPLILISLMFLLNSGIQRKNIALIVILGLIGILPASITTGYPHAMRAYALLPIPQILAAIGFISILFFIRNKKFQYLFVSLSLAVIIFSALWFFHSYFVLLPRELSHHFQYGAINAISYAKKIDKNYDKVVVSNKDRLFESYMFYLYFSKYDPSSYQRKGGTISGGFEEEHSIDNYTFGDIKDKIGRNRLYIINPEEKTPKMRVVKEIKYPNGQLALIIAEIL